MTYDYECVVCGDECYSNGDYNHNPYDRSNLKVLKPHMAYDNRNVILCLDCRDQVIEKGEIIK